MPGIVLYGIESDQLLGYTKQGDSPSDSTGSKETVSLEIQEKQVQRVLGDPGNPVMKLLDLDYRDTLKTADAKAYAQLNLLKVGRFLEIILISWNAVLSKSKYAAEWKLLYTQVTATPGSYWNPFDIIRSFKREIRPSIGELANLNTQFSEQQARKHECSVLYWEAEIPRGGNKSSNEILWCYQVGYQ